MNNDERINARLVAAAERALVAMQGEPAVVRAMAALTVWFEAMDELPPETRREGIVAAINDMRAMLSDATGESTH